MKREELRTPCYVIMESEMKKNLQILQEIRQQSGCKILLAQKAFSMYSCYPLIGEYLDGTTASGLYEAKLGKECMGKENHIFSPAYREDEFEEVLESCEHLVFNSFSQLECFGERAAKAGKSVGIRVNPECSTQGEHAIYDPCAPGSRLGILVSEFPETLLSYVEGLHFHTLCEQNADALEITLKAVEEKFGKWMKQLKCDDVRIWHDVCFEKIEPVLEDNELTVAAAGLLPPEPWNSETWNLWIEAVKKQTGKKGRDLFHPLRMALTGLPDGPELKRLLPFIGREKAYKRLNGIRD